MALIIDEGDLAFNNTRRVPTVLCIDKSESMGRDNKLELLNKAIKEFYTELRSDPLTKYAIDISIIEFDDEVPKNLYFQSIREGDIPQVTNPCGQTHLAEAIDTGITILETVKEKYKATGIGYYQPWLVVLSDGHSEGETEEYIEKVAQRSRSLEKQRKLTVIPGFIGNASEQTLAEFSKFSALNEAQSFDATQLTHFFKWFSQSLSTVANSDASDEAKISFSDFKGFLESMSTIG